MKHSTNGHPSEPLWKWLHRLETHGIAPASLAEELSEIEALDDFFFIGSKDMLRVAARDAAARHPKPRAPHVRQVIEITS